VTKIGGAIGARVQSVTPATAAVMEYSRAADVTAPTTAAAGRANKCWSMHMKPRSKLVASGHGGGERRRRVPMER
jgi:hypothetical protein